MKLIHVELLLEAERDRNGNVCVFLPASSESDQICITDSLSDYELTQAEQALLQAENDAVTAKLEKKEMAGDVRRELARELRA
jgi:hypothetical protein